MPPLAEAEGLAGPLFFGNGGVRQPCTRWAPGDDSARRANRGSRPQTCTTATCGTLTRPARTSRTPSYKILSGESRQPLVTGASRLPTVPTWFAIRSNAAIMHPRGRRASLLAHRCRYRRCRERL